MPLCILEDAYEWVPFVEPIYKISGRGSFSNNYKEKRGICDVNNAGNSLNHDSNMHLISNTQKLGTDAGIGGKRIKLDEHQNENISQLGTTFGILENQSNCNIDNNHQQEVQTNSNKANVVTSSENISRSKGSTMFAPCGENKSNDCLEEQSLLWTMYKTKCEVKSTTFKATYFTTNKNN